MTSPLIDLSHTVEDGLVTYKGLSGPIICDYLSREDSRSHYAEGTEFHIGKIEMVANTGTYIDSPFHRYEDGRDLSELHLDEMANVPGLLVRVDPTVKAIDKKVFQELDVEGKAVLIHTGWAKHWKTDQYFEDNPFITGEAAELLRGRGAKLVGIDSLNIDDTNDGSRPAHTILLGDDVLIVEHMCGLEHLSDSESFRFFAVPVKVKAFGTFPVRAFAISGK